MVPLREHTSKVLRCGRVLKGSQFYLHTPRSSTNGMNHTCLFVPNFPKLLRKLTAINSSDTTAILTTNQQLATWSSKYWLRPILYWPSCQNISIYSQYMVVLCHECTNLTSCLMLDYVRVINFHLLL